MVARLLQKIRIEFKICKEDEENLKTAKKAET